MENCAIFAYKFRVRLRNGVEVETEARKTDGTQGSAGSPCVKR